MDIINKTDAELSAIKKQIEDEIESRKPKSTTIYLHRGKEDNWELQRELKLTDAQMENALYIGYETAIKIEIDKDGNAYATHLEGVELKEKVRI